VTNTLAYYGRDLLTTINRGAPLGEVPVFAKKILDWVDMDTVINTLAYYGIELATP
jgi:hypothetical protein